MMNQVMKLTVTLTYHLVLCITLNTNATLNLEKGRNYVAEWMKYVLVFGVK